MLNMYGFQLLHGNAATALSEPYSVVMTKDRAIKYFGKTDVIGKTISIENFSGSKHNFVVTGVLNNFISNSVTDLIEGNPNHFFVSISNLDFFGRNMNWSDPHIVGYIELQKGITPAELEKPIAQLLKENAPPYFVSDLKPYLLSLKDCYLSANNGLVTKMLYALSAIALFILLMAIINFVNMLVSSSAPRMKEIGIRKVLGGMKKQLIFQFLFESIIIVFIATLFAFSIYLLTQNFFSDILGKPIPSLGNFPSYFVIFPLLFILSIGIISGIYPAFIMSSFNSIDSLKGKLTSGKDHVLLRKSLIAFQFCIATIAFIGAMIISKQINLFLHSNLGYNKDCVLSAQLPRNWTREGVEKMETIRDEFATMPQVKNVSLSFDIPDGNYSNQVPIFRYGKDSSESVSADILEDDEKYLSLYQIPLIAGLPFEGHRLDSLKVILNETAIKALGWKEPEKAIGQQVKIPGNQGVYTVTGVMEDFHFGSMQTKVEPIIMFNLQYDFIYRYLSFKIKPGNAIATVAALKKKWTSLLPGTPFEYTFMDETLATMYRSELQLRKASYTALALALIIVLLGVTGLISLSIQKRTKEIGIRKVLGSSVSGIVSLFVKEFLSTIFIGGLVAAPLAYIIMNSWLQNYAYRINMTTEPFIISILVLGLITVLIICIQTIKTALANPVDSLRNE